MSRIAIPAIESATGATADIYAGQEDWYASPLHSSRLRNLPPALILSVEGDPVRDEAEQYGNRLINSGVRTTVRRLPPTPLQAPGARNQCACQVHALGEIASFIAGLDGPPPPPA